MLGAAARKHTHTCIFKGVCMRMHMCTCISEQVLMDSKQIVVATAGHPTFPHTVVLPSVQEHYVLAHGI
jgi:hypothetical protein